MLHQRLCAPWIDPWTGGDRTGELSIVKNTVANTVIAAVGAISGLATFMRVPYETARGPPRRPDSKRTGRGNGSANPGRRASRSTRTSAGAPASTRKKVTIFNL